MSYQSDIYEAIQSSAAMVALIGDRFFWDIADGSTQAPYLVAQTVSTTSDTTHDGFIELDFPLVQFTAWGPSKAQVIQIISTLRREIEGRDIPGNSCASLVMDGIQSTYDRETKYYGEIIDFRVSTYSN